MELLWVDKHRPRKLSQLTYHDQITQVLKQLSQTNDFPHLILYGPDGAGKKTRSLCFCQSIFGPGVYKLKSEDRSLKLDGSSTTIEYNLLSSNFHIQITPSDSDNHDRHIIQNVVKDLASTSNVNANNHKKFKLLIINEADKLSKQAQGALRRTMEQYVQTCRMILICQHIHKLIQPIRSRCVNIRIPAPQQIEIMQILTMISKSQFYNPSQQHIQGIIKQSNRNLRVALLQLQASRHSKNSLVIPPYRKQILDITKNILKQQSANMIKKIRQQLYDLLVNCVEASTILKQLTLALMDQKIHYENKMVLTQQSLKQFIHQGSQHQNTLSCGSKPILHLQSFCAHIMQEIMNNGKSM